MKINIGDHECSECWDGVFYKKLSNYPDITDYEIQTIRDFIAYERLYGRDCAIEGDKDVIDKIKRARLLQRPAVPEKITECTACPTYKGCMTDLVCHTSPLENAVKILACGSLLSPVRARKMTAAELRSEARNAANDPEDYFEYIMFAWGNCQAGDRLVMERKLGRFPNERDLSVDFTPGVRFFFKYEKLARHPKAVFDGVLPMKVKDEVVLNDYVHAVIAPNDYKNVLNKYIPDELRGRVHFIRNDCADIWEWSEKVYELARRS